MNKNHGTLKMWQKEMLKICWEMPWLNPEGSFLVRKKGNQIFLSLKCFDKSATQTEEDDEEDKGYRNKDKEEEQDEDTEEDTDKDTNEDTNGDTNEDTNENTNEDTDEDTDDDTDYDTDEDTDEDRQEEFEHYKINSDEEEFWFDSQNKFNNLTALIESCMGNKQEGLATKLTNICLLASPHSDPTTQFPKNGWKKWQVPLTEIKLGEKSGQSEDIYKAKFRGMFDAEARQLKIENEEQEQKAESDIAILKKLKHPNLIHLFAFTRLTWFVKPKEGNIIIQEFMAEGDLKNYLRRLKSDKDRRQIQRQSQIQSQNATIWDWLVTWIIEVARGMEQLESLKIAHRDVAARYKPLVSFSSIDPSQECLSGPVFSG